MGQRFKRHRERDKRCVLRREVTPSEAIVWVRLRDRRAGGDKWRRQHSVGPDVLDFYCPARRFALELDGNSYQEASLATVERLLGSAPDWMGQT